MEGVDSLRHVFSPPVWWSLGAYGTFSEGSEDCHPTPEDTTPTEQLLEIQFFTKLISEDICLGHVPENNNLTC